jgi:hypothetical protein
MGLLSLLFRVLASSLVALATNVALLPCSALATQPEAHETVKPPDSAVGRQLQWILDVANGSAPGDAAARMSDHFQTLFTPDELVRELRKVREQRFNNTRIRLTHIGQAGDDALSGFVEGGGRQMSIFIAVDDQKKIDGLRFADAAYAFGDEGDRDAATWDEFDGMAGNLPGKVSFGAYEIVLDTRVLAANAGLTPPPTTLKPIHTIHEDEALALGSAAQLFVLHALADASLAKKINWEERVPFRENLRVLALGDLKSAKEGTTFSIDEWATRMVTTGDAAANDTLFALLGRDAIQASYAKFAASTKRTRPYLSTRECLQLKLVASDEQRAGYIEADEAARRSLLAPDADLARLDLTRDLLKAWQAPRHIEDVGWFASAEDLAKLMMEFRRLEQHPQLERLGTMLRKERGLEFEEEWTSIAYKGGMEPGVVCMNWLFERDDHKWFVLSITWNNAKEPLNLTRFATLAQSGCTLLHNADKPKPPTPKPPKATPEDLNADGN